MAGGYSGDLRRETQTTDDSKEDFFLPQAPIVVQRCMQATDRALLLAHQLGGTMVSGCMASTMSVMIRRASLWSTDCHTSVRDES